MHMGINCITFESILAMSSKTGLWASVGLHSLWNAFLISLACVGQNQLTTVISLVYLVGKWILHW